MSRTRKSDNINDTLDYRQVISTVKTLIKNSRFALVEKLAVTIAEEILKDENAVIFPQKVQVTFSKLVTPITEFGGKLVLK
ncbi:MAG: dihydroneopterin aldolase [Cyanobacteria bacterium P01_A01_bin.45]